VGTVPPVPTPLRVNDDVVIDLDEVEWRFTASGGPGGQHANRSNTRVEARLDLEHASGLGDDARVRLIEKVGPVVRVVVDDERSQSRNRALATDRLRALLAEALVVPKRRRPTRPSKAAKERRLQEKRHRSETKQSRRSQPDAD
jgi:ribosome-associated protein